MKLKTGIVTALACLLFVTKITPISTYDTFFGIKIGELVTQTHQVPSKEVFSWSAYNRTWIAYEWLPQTLVYLLNNLGGIQAIEVYVAFIFALFFILSYLTLYKIVKRDFISSLLLSLFLSSSIYEFFVARPQIIAYFLYLLIVALLAQFILRKKNLLILTLPATYIWANSHASIIFVPFLFFSTTALLFIKYLLYKNTEDKKQSKTLAWFSLLNSLVTILPPLYFGPYQLLLDFFKDIKFLTAFLTEWAPLIPGSLYHILYLILLSVAFLLMIFVAVKKHWQLTNELILAIPTLVITLFSYQAIRHVPFAIISTVFIIGLFLPKLSFKNKLNQFIPSLFFTLALILTSSSFVYSMRETAYHQDPLPENFVNFLLKNHLNGKMYNDFAMGGYLIYKLYPTYQVFFDGRADIYHHVELPDYWTLVEAKQGPQADFINKLHQFLDKYQFSFIIIGMDSYNPLKFSASTLIADKLLDDLNFKLVYFDDQSQIFVKNDGQNNLVYQLMGKTAITPFRLNSYKLGKEKQALDEYKNMLQIQDSGVARTGLGNCYLASGDMDKAADEYKKALQLNPALSSAFLGLAQIALQKNNFNEAESYAKKVVNLNPSFGQAYLILSQAYSSLNQKNQADLILNQALRENIDLLSRQKIIQLLNQTNLNQR